MQRSPGADQPMSRVPYGDGEIEFMVQPWFDLEVLGSAAAEPVELGSAISNALADPLGGPKLVDLAREAVARRPSATAVIAVTDLTRASPDDALVPPLLAELNAGGIPDERITVMIGVGLHRATTEGEKREKLGAVVDRVRAIDSDGRDPSRWADLGSIPPYGVPGFTQKLVKDADLVVATGIVEPHQYAGYSGGRKTVAIGCCGEPTITATHGMRFLEDPGVRLGRIDGNPFHETVTEIARRAGLRFCLNVVVDDQERVIAVAAGEPDAVLRKLVERASAIYTRPIAKQYDIAIAGVGAPKDVNLYQASRAATYLRFAPVPVVRKGGSIIVPAQLPEGAGEGAGEQRFLAALENAASPAAVVEAARVHFAGGEQRAVMVALTLQHCQIVVAASESADVVRRAKMRVAVDVEEALEIAYEHIGRPERASLLLVPRALHTLPIVQGELASA
jgi:lactate racemase